ncbi:hypothetical protein EA58_19465 [Photobacterium galatheae]|uniref:Prepilin type IV endopeptidase peptidase domain-containing protein n=1 Tax=Photobacterium galatheae TaxID=1654360 RepID=A0A066RIG0_9GAMM|nr:hypothetical protein EA58_19465 [Photobacterium galatheae]
MSNILIVLITFIISFFLLGQLNIQLEVWEFDHLWSLLFVILFTCPFFYKGVFGAADVKILLVLSVICPLEMTLNILLYSFLCFVIFWLLFVRRREEAPFVPSLWVGVVVSLWMI